MFNRSRLIFCLAIAFLAAAPVLTPADDKPADAKPPAPANPNQRPEELKALDALMGAWEVQMESRIAGAGPQPIVQKGRAVEAMQWVLDRSFLAGQSANESGRPLSAWMWGFDRATKTYRLWWFGVGGQVTEWQGAYNAETREFTLRTEALGGYQSTAIIKIIDDNNRTQSVKVHDPEGKLTQEIKAVMTRKK
jgi:Protein of unknown function (DUF1579)